MQAYRMWITFNDKLRPYHNRYTDFTCDMEALEWIKNYADRHKSYYWFKFIEYSLINIDTGKVLKGKVSK